MTVKKYTEEQTIAVLREDEAGAKAWKKHFIVVWAKQNVKNWLSRVGAFGICTSFARDVKAPRSVVL
jgi:uncharacterized protein YcbX